MNAGEIDGLAGRIDEKSGLLEPTLKGPAALTGARKQAPKTSQHQRLRVKRVRKRICRYPPEKTIPGIGLLQLRPRTLKIHTTSLWQPGFQVLNLIRGFAP